MTQDRLLQYLSVATGPVETLDLAAALGFDPTPEDRGVVEVIATLCPGVRWLGGGWVASTDTPGRRVTSALKSYSDANPSKRIFRLSAAIGHLPAQDQMTEDQLRATLSQSSDFQLLPNAMIKRVS